MEKRGGKVEGNEGRRRKVMKRETSKVNERSERGGKVTKRRKRSCKDGDSEGEYRKSECECGRVNVKEEEGWKVKWR